MTIEYIVTYRNNNNELHTYTLWADNFFEAVKYAKKYGDDVVGIMPKEVK